MVIWGNTFTTGYSTTSIGDYTISVDVSTGYTSTYVHSSSGLISISTDSPTISGDSYYTYDGSIITTTLPITYVSGVTSTVDCDVGVWTTITSEGQLTTG